MKYKKLYARLLFVVVAGGFVAPISIHAQTHKQPSLKIIKDDLFERDDYYLVKRDNLQPERTCGKKRRGEILHLEEMDGSGGLWLRDKGYGRSGFGQYQIHPAQAVCRVYRYGRSYIAGDDRREWPTPRSDQCRDCR